MCTGIRLVARDGSPVFGRTMEFGADMLSFNLIAVPKGTSFRGATPDGETGLEWQADHAFVAAIPYRMMAAMEGVNDAGSRRAASSSSPMTRRAIRRTTRPCPTARYRAGSS